MINISGKCKKQNNSIRSGQRNAQHHLSSKAGWHFFPTNFQLFFYHNKQHLLIYLFGVLQIRVLVQLIVEDASPA